MCQFQRLILVVNLGWGRTGRTSQTRTVYFVTYHCIDAVTSSLAPNDYCQKARPVPPAQFNGKEKGKDSISVVPSDDEWRRINFEEAKGRQDTLCQLLNDYAEKNQRWTARREGFLPGATHAGTSQPQTHSIQHSSLRPYEAVPLRAATVATASGVSESASATVGGPYVFPATDLNPEPQQTQRALAPSFPMFDRKQTNILPMDASRALYEDSIQGSLQDGHPGATHQQQEYPSPPPVLEPSRTRTQPSNMINRFSGLRSLGLSEQRSQRVTPSLASGVKQLPKVSHLGLPPSDRPARED